MAAMPFRARCALAPAAPRGLATLLRAGRAYAAGAPTAPVAAATAAEVAVALAAAHGGGAARAPAILRAPAPPPQVFFFVRRAALLGSDFAEVGVRAGASVASLKKAAMRELRLDMAPDAVALALAPNSLRGGLPASGAALPRLDSTLSLDAAFASGLLAPGARLLLLPACAGGASQAVVGSDSSPGDASSPSNASPLPYSVVCEPGEGDGARGEIRGGGSGGGDTQPEPIASEADFVRCVRGDTMWAVRSTASGKEGRLQRSRVSSLASARRALGTPGTRLVLHMSGTDSLFASVPDGVVDLLSGCHSVALT
jgi:hypothetical protein